MKNILVVNVNWLGDVVFSSPVFKALKEAYPQARVSCLAPPRVREILESIPFIDDVIMYDEKGRHWGPFAKGCLIMEIRRRRFDAAFLLHRSWTRALLIYLAGIPVRVGYDAKGRAALLTHIVRPLEGTVHRSDHYLNVIESFGVAVKDRRCLLEIPRGMEDEVDGMLAAQGIFPHQDFIVVNPGGNWDLKQWPPAFFSILIDRLMREFKASVVVSGAAKDQAVVAAIVEPLKTRPVVMTGRTNLKQLMVLLRRASIFISADSGPLHLASGLGVPVIGIFGPTRPEVTGPRGSKRGFILQREIGCNQEPCYHLKCPDHVCMQAITVEDVLEIVRQIQNS